MVSYPGNQGYYDGYYDGYHNQPWLPRLRNQLVNIGYLLAFIIIQISERITNFCFTP